MRRKKDIMCRSMPLLAVGIVLLSVQGCSAGGGETEPAFSNSSGRQTEETEKAEEATEHLLTVWFDYQRVREEMYASELWALDYVEQYLETGNWEDLSRARTACIAAARFLSELSMEEEDLSDEEYSILAETGMDVTFQSEQMRSIEKELEETHTFVRNRILESLEEDIFFSSDVERLKEEIELEKEYCSCLIQSECNTLNYLLLMLEDRESAEDYWENLPDKYPTLGSECLKWSDSETELRMQEDQCLDHMQEIILGKADLEAAMQADLYELEQIIEKGSGIDWKNLSFAMSNTPVLLPMPEWYDSETAGYLSFTKDNEGNVVYPESGDKLTDDSYGVYIEIEGISGEELNTYVDLVRNLAQGAQIMENKEGWSIMMPDYSVQISLEDDTATLVFYGQDVTFAPVWYFEE